MLSERDTRLLSEIGPGAPMGELFRRFWLPVLLSEELPEPDCPPRALRILGEDLVAFRETNGRVGLLQAHCAHRHAHLFWGRNEECGLRCTYHGWKYDVDGNCIDMPNEPAESTFKDKISITAYPTREAGGCVWAYMGPRELMPPDIPQLEWTRVPDSHVLITKRLQESNWAQAVEGGIDSSHISFLHSTVDSEARGNREGAPLATGDSSPLMLVSPRDFGFVEAARRVTPEGKHYWRVRPFLLPSSMIIPGGDQRGRNLSGHVWVPIDDHHVWTFTMTWNAERPLTGEERERALAGLGIHAEVDKESASWDLAISNSYRPLRNKSNSYLIDRQQQRTRTFTGIRGISEQDCSIQESMGKVSPRWLEHLGTSDSSIIEFRRVILAMARDLLEGKEPEQPHRPDIYRVRSTAFVVDPDVDWEVASEEHLRALV